MKLTAIFATRERPRELLETVRHTVLGMTRPDTKLLVLVDADDHKTIAALHLLPTDERLSVSVKEREDTRGLKYARALTEAPADLYMVGHDAAPVLTPGWDQMFVNGAKVFPDGIGVVCSRMANASFPQMQAVTQGWVDLTGYIYNPAYPFWFIDHELDDLARMTGRVVFVDVDCSIRDMRPTKTIRLRDLTFWMDYFDMARFRRRSTARKLINAMDEPEWRKDMMRSWYHPVEMRSESIHAGLRQNAFAVEFGWTDQTGEFQEGRGEGGEPDAGYLRAFDKARRDLIEMDSEISYLYRDAA